jgi:hypothetical protein
MPKLIVVLGATGKQISLTSRRAKHLYLLQLTFANFRAAVS